VPYPIQSGSITERLRKFFRIRGKTSFQLDEMVAPVVLVQDLTQGPYQAGVTPAAATITINVPNGNISGTAIILNDKTGSVTPVLGNQFEGRSFSVTWLEIQYLANVNETEALLDCELSLANRGVLSALTPDQNSQLVSIQNNDGGQHVPVEMFGFNAGIFGASSPIWRGALGNNLNILGSRRTIEPFPHITIGPVDAIIFRPGPIPTNSGNIILSMRGFYQEQPA